MKYVHNEIERGEYQPYSEEREYTLGEAIAWVALLSFALIAFICG